MEKFLKAFAVSVFILLVVIVLVSKLPKFGNSTSFDNIDIAEHIKALNCDLPRDVGTIGKLESITYEDNMICYLMSVYGDPIIMDFYEKNYDTFKTVILYSFALLNGQNENATKLAEFEAHKGIGTKWIIKTSDNRSLSWEATGEELLEFIQTNESNPTEIVTDLLDFQIELTNYQLNNITSNSIIDITEEGIKFKSISHSANDVIMTYILDESIYNMDNIIANSTDKEFLEELAAELVQDPDMQELINLVSISHSNIVIRYQGDTNNKFADLKIAYQLLKKYSQVPNLK